MKKRRWIAVFCAVLMLVMLASGAIACRKKEQAEPEDGPRDYTDTTVKTYTPTLSLSDSTLEIGVAGVTKWVFKRSGNNWLFDGIYAMKGSSAEKVFTGASGRVDTDGNLNEDGAYFNVLSTSDADGLDKHVNGFVETVTVSADEANKKAVTLQGKGFTSTLTVSADSQFVERRVTLTPPRDYKLDVGDVSFSFKSKVDEYTEYGYILSRKADDTQYSLPYSFPALAGKLTRQDDENKVFTYIDVIDLYDTAGCFNTARRRVALNDYFEAGMLSSDGMLRQSENNTFIERVCVRPGTYDSFYDLIYDARSEYAKLYEIDPLSLFAANSNMNVTDWDEAVYGAMYDELDSRGRPLGDDYGWGPYGYNNGGVEAGGTLDQLKGMIRYAQVTGDNDLYDFAMKYLLQFVRPDPKYNKCFIMPLNSIPAYKEYTDEYFFFLQCFGNDYGAVDSYMGPNSKNFGAFKYFTRCAYLGELAILTDNAELKEAYLKLMVMVKRLRGENFEQPIEWGLDGTPKLDFENGGSSGAEAMWANCMYIASEITTNERDKAEYLEFMRKATDQANKQGFERSSSLRHAPKPESVGYIARMNLKLYEMTGEKSYLNYALQASRGVYFFYFHNSHPHTYFQTLGYGYACAYERWEAFWEMVETLELLVPILEYTDDPLLYQLYYQLRESAMSTLPVNGYPEGVLGGHSDWLDALYVPFEQPTGALGDNGLADGGAMSVNRHSKEMYGMGEIWMGAMMYTVLGKAVDPDVLVLNYTATWLHLSNTENAYKLYNFGAAGDRMITFPHYAAGSYTVARDGKTLGTFTAAQLQNGIAIRLESKAPAHIRIAPSETEAQAGSVDAAATLSVTDIESDSATATVTAAGAAYYRLYVSRGRFSDYNTTVRNSASGVFKLGFEDASTLYLKATAFDANGNAYKESQTATLRANGVEIGVQDDFNEPRPAGGDSLSGWTAYPQKYTGPIALICDNNGFNNYPTDAEKYRRPTGYMAISQPSYKGYDVDTFTKTYIVDLGEYPLFDFYPFCKNVESTFTLAVKIGDDTYTLIDKAAGFDLPNYRFDLVKITGKTGTQAVQVIWISEGYNRGFAIQKQRFVKETAHTDAYDLNTLTFTSNATVEKENGMLTLTNGSDMVANNRFSLPPFDPAQYTDMEIVFDGMTDQQNGFIAATVTVFDGAEKAYQTSVSSVKRGAPIKLKVADMQLDAAAHYAIEITFRRGQTPVDNIAVKKIRLTSDQVTDTTEGFDPATGFVPAVGLKDGEYQMVNGWGSNWAFPVSSTGRLQNRNPGVGYGSIFKTGIAVDLSETPVLRFKIGDVKGASYGVKCNDGTMGTDLTVKEGNKAGTFEVNIADLFKRTGVVNMRLDFYVLNNYTDSTGDDVGVVFDGYAFVKGKTLYENVVDTVHSVTTSETFTLNTNKANYLVLDVPDLTYGAKWLVYIVDENGLEYEVKSIYEVVYSKMYNRAKKGVFKYELTDFLPKEMRGKDATVSLKIVLDGENTHVTFGSIRLATDNDTLVLQRVCAVR